MAAIAKDDLAQAWRAADNAFIEMTTIRAVIDTLNMPGTGEHEVLGARYLRHTKSIVVRERTPFQQAVPDFGDPRDRLGLLALARLVESPADLWRPPSREDSARAAELWPSERDARVLM